MLDVNNTLEQYTKAEAALYPAESAFRALDTLTKTILAENDPREGTVKDRETQSLISSEYKDHLNNLNTARGDYLRARANRDIFYNRLLVEKSSLTG